MSNGFQLHIIGAGRGGTSLLAGLIDAHPECEIHSEEYSTKYLANRKWTAAEIQFDPVRRIEKRIDNFIAACSRKAADFPDKIWGHKTTTEQIKALEHKNIGDLGFGPKILRDNSKFDALDRFLTRVADIKTIFILRDGRSCVRSKVRRTGQTVEEAVRRWKYSVRVLGVLRAKAKDLHVVKLEDLILHPTDNLRSICDFLEIDYVPDMQRGTQSRKMLPSYRQEGFDTSTIDVNGVDEPWVEDIRAELMACGYVV